MRIFLGAYGCAVEGGGIVIWIAFIDFEIAALHTIVWAGTSAAATFHIAFEALPTHFVCVMIGWAFVFTLFAALVISTFGTDL